MKGTTTATGRILPAVRRQTYQVSQLWANSTADESPSHLENTREALKKHNEGEEEGGSTLKLIFGKLDLGENTH